MLREEDTTVKSWDLLAMSLQERKDAMRKIATFVEVLQLLGVEVAKCWYLHPRQACMLARLMEWDTESSSDPKGTARGAFEFFTFGIAPYSAAGFSSHGHHREKGAAAHELSRKTPTPTFEAFIDSPAFDEVWRTATDDDDHSAVTEGDELAG